VVQLTGTGNKVFMVTTNNSLPGFFVSLDGAATCSAGGQPKDGGGLNDPLRFVFTP
jgi:hypothetical protein